MKTAIDLMIRIGMGNYCMIPTQVHIVGWIFENTTAQGHGIWKAFGIHAFRRRFERNGVLLNYIAGVYSRLLHNTLYLCLLFL